MKRGEIMGNSKHMLSSKVFKAAASKKTNKKQLRLSIVSLILTFAVLVSATFCWYALGKGSGTASNVTLSVGNGLRVNDLGDTTMKFNDDSFLRPASSVDGRNLFFPADGSDFSKETSRMTFRSANAGDRNFDYVQLDFNLTAEANYTGIYLDKSTSLKIEIPSDASAAYIEQAAKAEKALRTAIYYDGMDKPVVFTSQMNPCSVNAVKDIDRTTGRFLESSSQVAVPFKDYSYGKHQLAVLNQGETRPFSLIIWLEGTDEVNCVSDAVMLKQLVLNLKFTTSWDNTEDIVFEDISPDQDVAAMLNQHLAYSLVLHYENKAHNIDDLNFTMQKVAADDWSKWHCSLPGNAYNDLTFQIRDGSGNNAVVYEWKVNSSGGATTNRGTATTYYAEHINPTSGGDTNSTGTQSYGHWFDGDSENHGEGHDSGIYDNDDW